VNKIRGLESMKRERILENFKSQIKMGNHIIGVATGSGMTAKYAKQGGANFF